MFRLSFFLIFSIVVYAQSPHGEKFNIECGECHTTSGWNIIPSEADFNHDKTNFPLTGQHRSINCMQCHSSLVFSDAPIECMDCHKDIHQNTVGQDCARCHQANSWLVTNINELHQLERFPLTGAHITAACEDCHSGFVELQFTSLNVNCFYCHSDEYYAADSPNHIQAGFSTECEECHSITEFAWKSSNVSHDFFPLTGGHNIANCFDCHKGGTFIGLSKQCFSCHAENFQAALNPDHNLAGFSTECEGCHNINGWRPAAFDHSSTQFALTGAHQSVQCSTCHSEGYSNTSTQCYSCHKPDYDNSINPNHIAAGFPVECESCHNTNAWTPASFDHDARFFPIYSGEHAGEWNTCSDCHTQQNNFSVFSCIDCHEHNKTATDDEHREVQGYVYASEDCFACHPNGTAEGSVNHSLTNFPLTGAHLIVNCSECHQNGYSGTPLNCVDCHNDDYQKSTNPSHQSLALSTECVTCHTTQPGWQPAAFSVHINYYELTGAHVLIANDCAGCHNGNYAETPDNCYGCHQDNYKNASNPNHINAGLSQVCEDCHTTTAWASTIFQHLSTGFELTGAHQSLQCSGCHNGTTTGLSGTCIECHQLNYDSAPDHKMQNYPTECEMCHNTTIWTQTDFDHSATNFPLTGAHTSTSCSVCHQSGYTNTPVNCVDCHNVDYQNSTNPPHQTLALSTECGTCHTTQPGWQPATFSLHNNYFQLIGAHAALANDCAGCHNGNYINTPNTCYGCHAGDYNGTTNPVHASAGFGTECIDCHSQSAWTPSTFDHDAQYFPIYSGSHRGEWNNCTDCHTQQNNFAIYSCIDCHEHNKTETDNEHKEVSGYVYLSTACFDCHPNGEGDQLRGIIR